MEVTGVTTMGDGPAWDNRSEYASLSSPEFTHDLQKFEVLHLKIRDLLGGLENCEQESPALVHLLQEIAIQAEQAFGLIANLSIFAACEDDIDSANLEALKLRVGLGTKAQALSADLKGADHILENASDEFLSRYLNHPKTQPEEFYRKRARLLAKNRLPVSEESLLIRMGEHGPTAFARLYQQISSHLKCQIKDQSSTSREVSYSQASVLLRGNDEPSRRITWHAIQDAWKTHEIPVAAVLNGLAGWRLEVCQQRSFAKPVTFLDEPLHRNALSLETLETMMATVESFKPLAHRAMRAIARGLGKKQVDPWDLLAGAPKSPGENSSPVPFADGLSMIRQAFNSIDPSLAAFVDMMRDRRWIECRVLPRKRQGAYCTGFRKSRTPRVFQTYMGSLSDVRTLAHELGHAYHSWTLRDLPPVLTRMPSTLAETASLFAETAFADDLSEHSVGKSRAFEIAWQNVESAISFLLNIPSRFEFERNFYELRSKVPYVTAGELNDLNAAAWNKWYGDTLSKPEHQFWMTKLHFSMSTTSFYNFPYTFGYLFALKIYARRKSEGPNFLKTYIELLRDTGRLTVEDLAQKHLGEDVRASSFWNTSFAIIESQVAGLEALLK